MKRDQEIFAIFPIKGISIDPREEIDLSRDWQFVSAASCGKLNAIPSDGNGLEGNAEALKVRMQADALLLVKRHSKNHLEPSLWERFRETAERIAAGTCLAILLQNRSHAEGSDRDRQVYDLSTPMWIPTTPENCELPFLFGRDRLLGVGHTSWMSWCNQTEIINRPPWTNKELDHIVSLSPQYINKTIHGKGGTIERSAIALCKSFNCVSLGQFVSQSMVAIDVLVGQNDSVNWKKLSSQLQAVSPVLKATNIERILKCRHKFVHRGTEPNDASIGFKTLAVIVSSIQGYAALLMKYGKEKTVTSITRALAELLNAQRHNESIEVNTAIAALTTPSTVPKWVSDWSSIEVYEEPHRASRR